MRDGCIYGIGKGIDDILCHLEPTVEVVDIFKPVYNFKAVEDFPRFR